MLNRFLYPAIPAAILLLTYVWSLPFGYLWDDYVEVNVDLADAIHRLVYVQFRVFHSLSFAFTNPFFDQPFQHRLINLSLMVAAAVFGVHAARRFNVPAAPLVVSVILLHPTYVYPVTWISQRNDLFLLVFVFLAIANTFRGRGLVYLILSDVSKTPWVLQNVWYAWQVWRKKGPRWQVFLALVAMPLVIAQAFLFWGDVTATSFSPMSELSAEGFGAFVFTLLVRVAKVLESWFLIHIPVAAFYGAAPIPVVAAVVAAYGVAWLVILLKIFRERRWTVAGWHFLALAILMSGPFVANNDPRVFGPAIPFFIFFWVSMSGWDRNVGIALGLIAILNLGGTVLNYRLSDTGVYEPVASVDYTLCGVHEMQFPMERWRCDRSHLARIVVRGVNQYLN